MLPGRHYGFEQLPLLPATYIHPLRALLPTTSERTVRYTAINPQAKPTGGSPAASPGVLNWAGAAGCNVVTGEPRPRGKSRRLRDGKTFVIQSQALERGTVGLRGDADQAATPDLGVDIDFEASQVRSIAVRSLARQGVLRVTVSPRENQQQAPGETCAWGYTLRFGG